MKNWTWAAVWIFGILVGGIVLMFVKTDDAELQGRLIGLFGSLVPLVIGAGAGAAVGGRMGYLKGQNS